MWSPSGGLSSVSGLPGGGKAQAASELAKTKQSGRSSLQSSSTLRSPSTLVRWYSGWFLPVKS